MATFSGTVNEALEEWTTERFMNRYADRREGLIYPRIMRVESSNRAWEEAWEVSGLGTFVLKPEGSPVAYDDPVQGNRTRISHQNFALGFRVTEEMRDDDRWDVISKMPEDLADSGMDHQERLAHGVYNDAAAGATYTGLDGQALLSTTHTQLKTGGTRSNRLTTALTVAGLEATRTQARLTQDENGRQIPFFPNLLLIHPDERHNAEVLLESEFAPFVSGDTVAKNDINTMASSRSGITPIDSPYLNDTNDWFLLDTSAVDVRWFNRKGMDRDTGTDFDTKDMKFTASYRAGVGFWKWEGVWGNVVA